MCADCQFSLFHLSDRDLVLIAQQFPAQRNRIVSVFFQRYYGLASEVAMRTLQGPYRDSFEDIVQEAFLCLWLKLDKMREPYHVGGFLEYVTRNKALKFNRKHKRCDRVEPDSLDALVGNGTKERGDDFRELYETLAKRLSTREKRILDLRIKRGYTYSEVAEAEGICIGSVGRHVSEAMGKLRKSGKFPKKSAD